MDRTGVKRVRWTARGDYFAMCSSDNIISIVSPLSGDIKGRFAISENMAIFACSPKRNMIAVVTNRKEERDVIYSVEIVKFVCCVCLTDV